MLQKLHNQHFNKREGISFRGELKEGQQQQQFKNFFRLFRLGREKLSEKVNMGNNSEQSAAQFSACCCCLLFL